MRWVDFDTQTGELDLPGLERVLGPQTRIVAVTAASNLIGTMPDVPAIAALVHAAGALLYVDGVHYTAHAAVDVRALGADFFACSPYKFLGPHCGVVAAAPGLLERLHPDKLAAVAGRRCPSGSSSGTLPYELMAGAAAAVDFLAGLTAHEDPGGPGRRERLVASMSALERHEDRLRGRIEGGLAGLPGVRLHSRAARRTPTLLVTFDEHDVREVRDFLAARNVNAPAGSFYAYEAGRRLGLGDAGGLRIGLAPYNDDADVDRLLEGLTAFLGG